MMKFLILLFISFTLISCDASINSNVYISSVGFDISEGKIVSYYLSNPHTDISRGDGEKDKKTEFFTTLSESIYEGFMEAKSSLLSPLNFLHIKTMIMTEEFLNSKYIKELLTFLKSVRFISYNFYCFATTSKIDELYMFKNPEQISYQYSILSSPDLLEYSEYGIKKLHFLDFANDYYDTNRYLHIPLINKNEGWKEEITIEVDGFIALSGKTTIYDNKEFKGMLYLYDRDSILFNSNDIVYRISNYKVNYYVKNDVFTFSVMYDDFDNFGKGSREDFEDKLSLEIKKYLDFYSTNQNGLYLIKFYNYLNNTFLDVYNYNIEISFLG